MITGPITPSDLALYRSPRGVVKIGVLLRDETVWLTQQALSALFAVGVPAIAKHLKDIFDSRELDPAAVVSILETTGPDGKNYQRQWYSLDAVIAVGYRVNSYEATQFRIWATAVLRELITKGYVLDKERLEQGPTVFGKDYFEGLVGAAQRAGLWLSFGARRVVNLKEAAMTSRARKRNASGGP